MHIAESGVPFVVDEAYVENAGLEISILRLTAKYKNLIVI